MFRAAMAHLPAPVAARRVARRVVRSWRALVASRDGARSDRVDGFRRIRATDEVAAVQEIRLLVSNGPGAAVGPRILKTGYTEREFTEFAQSVIPRGGEVVDVGASMGYFTCLFAHWVGPAGRVVAFEPQREALEYLRSNLAGNRFSNVDVEEVALFDRPGPAYIELPSYRVTPGASDAPSATSITLARLDDVPSVQRLRRLDAIKIDIEGAELAALRGMTESIRRWWPVLLIEVHPDFLPLYGSTAADLDAFLGEIGYDKVVVEYWRAPGSAHHLVAASPERLQGAHLVPVGNQRTVFAGSRADWHAIPGDAVRATPIGSRHSFDVELPDRAEAHLVSPEGALNAVPAAAEVPLLPEHYTRIRWHGTVTSTLNAAVVLFEYNARRLVRKRAFLIQAPEQEWSMLSAHGAQTFRVALRMLGSGRLELEQLQIDQWE